MNEKRDPYQRFLQKYEMGDLPWDDPLPPPEIIELAAALPPGKALDLGCGFGRTAIYLAQHGWTVDGVDFIPTAIEVARQRAEVAGVGDRARFHQGSAAELGFLQPPYDLAVDIGCMHSFDGEMLRGYRKELLRLLRPGGLYVLFAHLRMPDDVIEDDRPRGILEPVILDLMAGDFTADRVEHGITHVKDMPPWHSAWYWFRRL